MKKIFIIFIALFFTGCFLIPTPKVAMVKTFDEKDALIRLRDGDNTIKGTALVRQRNGHTITCAAEQVNLFPATEYATERFSIIYLNPKKKYIDVNKGFYGDPGTAPEKYYKTQKTTICDSTGNFEFKNVADGYYYVLTQVLWETGQSTQGGYFIQGVEVAGGETKTIFLVP